MYIPVYKGKFIRFSLPRKYIFVFFFFLLLFLAPPFTNYLGSFKMVVQAACQPMIDGKYTMHQRFGFGFDQHNCASGCAGRSLDEFNYQNLNAGWYFDWGSGNGNSGGPKVNLEYMGLVGGYRSSSDAEIASECKGLKAKIIANRSKYPSGMMWTVGNEIGWDDGRSAATYAREFSAWRTCLKSIDPTFKVGTGAIIQPTLRLPFNNKDIVCVNKEYPVKDTGLTDANGYQSGTNYFIAFIKALRDQYNNLPDFVVNHGYTPCNNASYATTNWKSSGLFEASIVEQRRVMKLLGLQNIDLIIKEFAPLPYTDYTSIQTYMSQTVDFLVNRNKNTDLGQPEDNYRMVQRWAWFNLNSWKGKVAQDNTNYPALELFDTNALTIKPLGIKYRDEFIAKYTAAESAGCTLTPTLAPTRTPTPTPTRTPTPVPTSTPTATRTPTPSFTPTPTRTPSPYRTPTPTASPTVTIRPTATASPTRSVSPTKTPTPTTTPFTAPPSPTITPTLLPSLTLTVTPTSPEISPTTVMCDKPYDLNTDGVVDLSDVSIVINQLGTSGDNLPADFNCDQIIDLSDFSMLISSMGK